jgi:hypothetical protein
MQSKARHGAAYATERFGPTRKMAATLMHEARGWTAPRLESAAGYFESHVAPRISAYLTDVARRIEPPRPSHRVRNIAIGALGACLLVGIAGALATRWYVMQDVDEVDEFLESAAERVESEPIRST